VAILTCDPLPVAYIRLIGNLLCYMQSKCRNFGTPASGGFFDPQALRTQDFAKGCGDIIGRLAEHITPGAVARMTLSVVSQREKTDLCRFRFRPRQLKRRPPA
jgi:hypothetical protein